MSRLGSVLRWSEISSRPTVAESTDFCARFRRLFFANDATDLVVSDVEESLLFERRGSSQKFVQEDAERVDVRSSIDVAVRFPFARGSYT